MHSENLKLTNPFIGIHQNVLISTRDYMKCHYGGKTFLSCCYNSCVIF